MNINARNRGRFQAQGAGVEESESWCLESPPTKSNGHTMVEALKGKLNHKALRQRKVPFNKAKRFVETAPCVGWDVSVQSYAPCPPYKDVRVDIEIIKGRAFKDD